MIKRQITDKLLYLAGKFPVVEIKSAKTFTKEYIKMQKYWQKITEPENTKFSVVYGGDESFVFSGTTVLGWMDASTIVR